MRIVLLYILLCINNLSAQFSDDFSDGDFTSNPTWMGDVNDFIVNSDLQLQLNASDAGQSFLTTPVSYPDSFELSLDFEMDFNPSGSNNLQIFFGLDNSDLSVANGYYIQVGEDGSNDALELYKLTNGVEQVLNRTTDGSIATNNVSVNLLILGTANDSLSLIADIGNTGSKIKYFTWKNEDIDFTNSSLIGFHCQYTSSRTDKFYFDNILIETFIPDVEPPQLLSVRAINESTLELNWDEALDEESIDPLNIEIDQNIGMGLTASISPSQPTKIISTFDAQFDGITNYTVSVQSVKDREGNASTIQTSSFVFAETPQPGSLKLSEILYDPYIDGSDFVEIYNSTNRRLNLEGVIIGNNTKDEEEVLPYYVLEANEYVAITEDIDYQIQNYAPPSSANFLLANLPSFNNGSGNVYISNDQGEWSEQFDYNDEYHNQLIDDSEGVSLERLSFDISAGDVSNWFSSGGNNNFATPGYENSNTLNIPLNEGFEIESTKFSPNNDGNSDQMRLIYNVDNPGKILNLSVYDSNGNYIKKIADNLTLGTQGIINWDGLDKDGNISRLGIYIIAGNCFDLDGNVTEIKKTVSIVDFVR